MQAIVASAPKPDSRRYVRKMMKPSNNTPTDRISSRGERRERSLVITVVGAVIASIVFSILFTVVALHRHVCMIGVSCVPNAALASIAAACIGGWLLSYLRRKDLAWVLFPSTVAVAAVVLVFHAWTVPRNLFETCILKPMPASVTIHQANWFFSCPPGVWIHFSASPGVVAEIIQVRKLERKPPTDYEMPPLWNWRWRPDWWTPRDVDGFTHFQIMHDGVQPWSESLWVNSSSNECLSTVW